MVTNQGSFLKLWDFTEADWSAQQSKDNPLAERDLDSRYVMAHSLQ